MAANKRHKIQTNFSGGVLSENAFGRIDTSLYENGLKTGTNIIIENPGGATRRPGTLFVREFAEDYVRLFPFSFNTQQTYLLAFTAAKITIFHDDILVAEVLTTYTNDQIRELDFAQSADSMVLTQGDTPTQILRRLGTDVDWEFIPLPFVDQPQELICADGQKARYDGTCSDASTPALQNVWGTLNGYPKYCTFFQGRLYLAACHFLPQSVWGSVIHDFFNFDVGVGEDNEAVHDILDTDFINPIVAIYAEKKLYVFSTGDEFVNNAAVITPAASSWQRASKYGSFGTVRPVAFDGGVVYLDRSGRTIRQMIFEDSIKSFDSAAVSMYSEHLIKSPIAMGIMKGELFQASNFLFMVNVDGTMAVLNLTRAIGMAAWVEWTTQGAFKDILTFNNEITYVLVDRKGKWILEKLQNGIYVDSGSTKRTDITLLKPDLVTYLGEQVQHNLEDVNYGTLPEGGRDGVIGDRNNFIGISYDTRSYGRVVVVVDGQEVYKRSDFIREPKRSIRVFDRLFKPIDKFAQDPNVEDLYFTHIPQTEFYLYSLIITDEVDTAQNFIDGLPHLIGREVVLNLDNVIFHDQTVIPGDQLPGGGFIKTYPDGTNYQFNEAPGAETLIQKYIDVNGVTTLTDGYYQGALFTPLTLNDFWNAYPITQAGEPVDGDEFLEEGIFVYETVAGNVIIDYNSISGSNPETVTGSNGSFTFTAPIGDAVANVKMVGGGASGNTRYTTGGDQTSGAAGGLAGQALCKTIAITETQQIGINIGKGGAAVIGGASSIFGNPGAQTIFGSDAVSGGVSQPHPACPNQPSFSGGSTTTCMGTSNNGSIQTESGGDCGRHAGGGQGSGAGAGGNGSLFDVSLHAGAGVAGAGGGGKFNGFTHNYGNSGAGGDGRVEISWSTIRRRYRVRKMILKTAEVLVTDGVVPTEDVFVNGQAGLWFGVDMETLPFNGGQMTNEPKRIVSVQPRYVDSAGMNVANNQVPERDFGQDILDRGVPIKSGLTKIRLLGYTRETTLRITQYDPLPMTLISIDIEIKF